MVSLWPLYLKRQVPLSRRVQASKAEVLAVAHDLEKVSRTSPLFVEGSFKADEGAKAPPGFTWYSFKEHVPRMFGIIPAHDITVRLMWAQLPDGTEARVFAALGTHLVNNVTVVELPKAEWQSPEQEECMINEVIHVEALSLFISYVASTVKKAHIALWEGVVTEVLKEQHEAS